MSSRFFRQPKSRIQGFSLIEILLVVGVIAVLAIAAFAIYPQVQARSKAQKEVQYLLGMIAGVQSLAGPAGNYGGLTNAIINQAGFVPTDWNMGVKNSGTLRNGYGGVITVRPSNGAASACGAAVYCPGFRVDMGDIPQEGCVYMLPALTARFDWVYVRQTGAGGSWYVVKSPLVVDQDMNPRIVSGCNQAELLTILVAT